MDKDQDDLYAHCTNLSSVLHLGEEYEADGLTDKT